MKRILTIVFFIISYSLYAQTVHRVTNSMNLQTIIDNANNGDIILVEGGNYGNLNIANNNNLSNVNALSNLESIGGYIYIGSNATLIDISGLANIEPATIEDLYIQENPSLAVCNLPNFCTYFSNPSNPRDIIGKKTTCINSAAVVATCTCPPLPILVA